MHSKPASRSRLFKVLGVLFLLAFVLSIIGPALGFLIDGKVGISNADRILSVIAPGSLAFFLLLLLGLIFLGISRYFSIKVFDDGVGKIHTVIKVSNGNVGKIKIGGINVRILSNTPISVGESVKGESVKSVKSLGSYSTTGQNYAPQYVTTRYLIVKKVETGKTYGVDSNMASSAESQDA